MDLATETAARLLNISARDVVRSYDHDHGTVVVTRPDTHHLLCEVPDGEGKTGHLLLRKPNPDLQYALPVFVEPDPDAPADDTDQVAVEPVEDVPPLPRPPLVGKGSGRAAWLAYAASRGVEVPDTATPAEIAELIPADEEDPDG